VEPAKLGYTREFVELMRYEGARARHFYEESMPLIQMVHRESRASLWALIQIYYRLLNRLEQVDYRVLDQRVRLSTAEKVWLVLQAGGRKLVGAL
jgi:phytoene synthase